MSPYVSSGLFCDTTRPVSRIGPDQVAGPTLQSRSVTAATTGQWFGGRRDKICRWDGRRQWDKPRSRRGATDRSAQDKGTEDDASLRQDTTGTRPCADLRVVPSPVRVGIRGPEHLAGADEGGSRRVGRCRACGARGTGGAARYKVGGRYGGRVQASARSSAWRETQDRSRRDLGPCRPSGRRVSGNGGCETTPRGSKHA